MLSSTLRRRLLLSHAPLAKFSPGHPEPSPAEALSDLEWEIRTGRAIDVLSRTLPDFFRVGLVDAPASESAESIYSPAVRLTYTPPVALPPPFPRTLSLEGLGLYTASSVFVRHAMKTLCADLRVEMRKLAVHAPTPNPLRDKSVLVGVTVHGTTRVGGGHGQWQIDSTYSFSPATGLVRLHRIESIQPAPHQAAYDALRESLLGMPSFGSANIT